jgi:5-methylcytosine-specific restriction endonuclease McrA
MGVKKICEQCGTEYIADKFQYLKQRYCNRRCKDRRRWEKQVISGDIRHKKGGYNRSTYISKWMEARLSDNTAPCHYCKTRLTPDDFVLDHKTPVASLTTKEEMIEESNLVVACRKCNQAKGSTGYKEFLEQMKVG